MFISSYFFCLDRYTAATPAEEAAAAAAASSPDGGASATGAASIAPASVGGGSDASVGGDVEQEDDYTPLDPAYLPPGLEEDIEGGEATNKVSIGLICEPTSCTSN